MGTTPSTEYRERLRAVRHRDRAAALRPVWIRAIIGILAAVAAGVILGRDTTVSIVIAALTFALSMVWAWVEVQANAGRRVWEDDQRRIAELETEAAKCERAERQRTPEDRAIQLLEALRCPGSRHMNGAQFLQAAYDAIHRNIATQPKLAELAGVEWGDRRDSRNLELQRFLVDLTKIGMLESWVNPLHSIKSTALGDNVWRVLMTRSDAAGT